MQIGLRRFCIECKLAATGAGPLFYEERPRSNLDLVVHELALNALEAMMLPLLAADLPQSPAQVLLTKPHNRFLL